ncbi:MAG: OmpA family protein [Vitreoscilla sp.]|nr:OmpA family protein [Vitreoscilla sp.]
MNRAKTYTLFAMLALGLAACSSTPIARAPMQGNTPVALAPAPAPVAAAPKPTPISTVTAVSLPEYLDPKSSMSTQRSVYFDFDVFSIRSDDAALIERHGKYLASHPAVVIKIEGHSDERGGAEYNLALGQKRAEAALRALRIYGVKDAQMEAVSWGESEPRAAGHDEAAWSQNRRADLQYPAK